MMRLDAHDFDAVWQHVCAQALVDHAQGTLIASFVREDGHWIQAVQPERLRVTSRLPRVRALAGQIAVPSGAGIAGRGGRGQSHSLAKGATGRADEDW
jgi:hypothetical protein